MLLRVWGTLFLVTGWAAAAQAAAPPLLEAAVQKWIASKGEWALTQRTRTFRDDGKVKEERVERYDPSLPDSRRWHLLTMNGIPPTAEEREHWEHRRNSRARKHTEKSPREYLDFDRALMVSETPTEARYDVAMRPEAARLVDTDKLDVEITVDKQTKEIERVTAGLSEPMNVAFGLAKITDVALDVRFDPLGADAPLNVAGPNATGAGRVVLTKFGDRAEYAWSDFKKVTPNH